jgi:signal transduction histidine kinase
MNVALVMFITMLLISFVALTMARKTVFEQKVCTGKVMLASLQQLIIPCLKNRQADPAVVIDVADRYTRAAGLAGLVLADPELIVLADSGGGGIGGRSGDEDLVAALRSRGTVTRTGSLQGRECLFMAAPLYQSGSAVGVLKIALPLADMEKSMALFQNLVIAFSITTAIAFVIIGSLLLGRYVVRPLEKLVGTTEALTGEYLPQGLEPTGRNQIGTLAASLSGISEKLREYKWAVDHYIQSLKESNRELRRAQEELIRSEKLSSVGRLAAGIAHEIGNPIGIILGYLEILRRSLGRTDENADALARVESEVMRIDRIIRELLSFARPSPVSLHPVAVNTVVEEAIELISHQKEIRAISVEKQLDRSLPPVMADESKLKQVMINLFINAMDAMQGGGKLTVATGKINGADAAPGCSAPEPAVSISVGDTGTGIDAESLRNIFDPFFTTKSPGKGNGLGLSVCLRIIEAFAGTIAVKSSPGAGSTFTIVLPVFEG